MGRCAAEYCSDEFTQANPSHRIPLPAQRTKNWLIRLGRYKASDTIPIDEVIMEHRVCRKHIPDKYLRKNKKLVTISKDALPMTRTEYTAHVAKLKQQENVKAQEQLDREALIRDQIQDAHAPLLRTSTRVNIPVATAANTKDKPEAQPSISELKKQLEAQSIALTNAIKKLDDANQSIQKLVAEGVTKEESLKKAADQQEALQDEVDIQQGKLENMHFQISRMAVMMKETRVYKLSYEYIMGTKELTKYWTGFQTREKFRAFMIQMKEFGEKYDPGRRSVTFEDAIVMWFSRVRHNLEQGVVMQLFGLSCTQTVSNILNDVNFVMYAYFRHPAHDPILLLDEDINSNLLLPCFEVDYPNTALVIDCTEYFIETSSNLDIQRATWSNYKHHNTVKQLVAMSGAGHCVFASPLMGGRISDPDITELYRDKLFKRLWRNASVMGDKGFHIQNLLPPDCTYNVPPLLKKDKQFTGDENNTTKKIASSRIHIERVNRRAKIFRFLAQEVKMVDLHFFALASVTCFYLTDIISPCVRRDV